MGLVDVWEYQFIVGVEDIVWCFAALLAFCIFAVGLERMIRAPYVSDVQEKHILITGCDTGFGRAAALKISRLGCTVFAGCLTEKGQRDLQEEAAGEGRKVITLKMDVTNDSSIERALKEVEKQLPKNTGLWGLVNNAGVLGMTGPIQWMSRSDVQKTLDVNVLGVVAVTRAFMPLLQQRRGRLVTTSSVVGHVTLPFTAPYCMSKHCMESLGNALRTELRPFGMSVHLIEPGIHRTPFMDPTLVSNGIKTLYKKQSTQIQEVYGEDYCKQLLYLSTDLIPMMGSDSTDGVVAAYEHALFSALPKRRYPVGRDSFVFMISSYLPSWLMDALFNLPLFRNIPAAMKNR